MSGVTAPPPPTDVAAEESTPRRRQTWLRDALEVLAIALVLYIVIWNAFQTVRVDGHSMDNTLADQDLLLASKISYDLHAPQRGDIVILIPPISPDTDFIKRVIAVPGDHLEIDGSATPVQVKIKPGGVGPWQVLSEPYLPEPWTQNTFCCNPNGEKSDDNLPHEVTVPANDYFVMGDNRNASTDSRIFGFEARDKIIAKAVVRLWPFFHFGLGGGSTLLPEFALLGALPPSWLLRRHRRLRSARTR